MVAKQIIIGVFLVLYTPAFSQISLRSRHHIDSLLTILDTTQSNYQITQLTARLLQLMDTTHSSRDLYRVYLKKGLSYFQSGDENQSLASLKAANRIAHQLQDSFLIGESAYHIGSVQYSRNLNESARQQKEIAALKKEKRLNYLHSYFIILFLLLALIISFFFVVHNRMKRQLAESELRNQQLVSEQIRQELEGKEKDLTNLALEIARKNELFVRTNEMLQEVQQSGLPPEQQKKITKLIRYNANQLRINEDLQEILVNIEQVNAEFFEKLAEIAPELTPAEKQLCALIRLNLGTKDIASIRNISPKSVEMARYRLRKKLPIEAGDDIYAFMQQF